MRRVLVAILIVTCMVGGLVVPASAGDVDATDTHTSGGSYGTGVYASVVVGGHAGVPGSYPQCNWQKVWTRNIFQQIIDGVRSIIAQVLGNPPPNFGTAELVLDINATDTNLFADGALAEILNRDPSNVVSYEGEDVNFIHELIVYLTGSERVGRFRPIADASTDTLDDNPLFPEMQRGTYRTPGGGEEDLWWDPYYVSVDDPGPDGPDQCPPGVFYSPRNSDPVTLVPDLQDYIHRNLPTLVPDLNPLDRDEGWAYVNVPVNFTAPASSIAPVQATAYVQDAGTGGTVWAQATATPDKMVFLPGDGTTVVCDVSDTQIPFDPADPGFCSHTYLDSSNTQPGGIYRAALGLTWRGEFVASNTGAAVTFPVPPSWTAFDLSVAEARPSVAIDER